MTAIAGRIEAHDASIAAVGMPVEEREARLKAIEKKVHALEVLEELTIRKAEAAGVVVDRRGDADPAIVLSDTA